MDILQVFYRGTDDSIWSQWRNPGGNWPGEQHIGGALLGDPIAARIPWGNSVHVMFRGTGDRLGYFWRDVNGEWKEKQIGGKVNGGISVGRLNSPGTPTFVTVFYRGTDNGVRWRLLSQGSEWGAEGEIGGVLKGNPIVGYIPGTEIIQLFYRGTDDGLWSRWYIPAKESWSPEQGLGGKLKGDPFAAVVPGETRILQVFYRGADDSIWSRWRNPGGDWSEEQHIGGELYIPSKPIGDPNNNPPSDPIAVQVPGTDDLLLLYRGTDKTLRSRRRPSDGNWLKEENRGVSLKGDPVTSVVPGTHTLQIFYRSTDDSLRSLWLTDGVDWSGEQNLGGILGGQPVASVLGA